MIRAVISILFRWFQRRYPVERDPSDLGTSTLSKPVFNWWTALSVVLMLITLAGIFFGIVRFAGALNHLIATRQGPSNFLLVPTSAWWHLYGGFAALSGTCFITTPVMRSLMGRANYESWARTHDVKYGFDGYRAMRFLALAIMVPYSLAFLPSIACHTRFSETEIGIQRYADFREARYGYADVAAIAIIKGYRDRSEEFHEDEKLVIDFRDGQRWSSRDSFRDPESIDPALSELIAAKTGLSYRLVDVEQDLN